MGNPRRLTRKCVQGTADRLVPYSCWGRLRLLVPSAKLLRIEGGGHDAFNEFRDLVIPEMVAWISGEDQGWEKGVKVLSPLDRPLEEEHNEGHKIKAM